MPLSAWFNIVRRFALLLPLLAFAACETTQTVDPDAGPARRASDVAAARLAADDTSAPKPPDQVPVQPMEPTTRPAISLADIQAQVPDPRVESERLGEELPRIPDEMARIDTQLARADLPDAERQTLNRRRNDLIDAQSTYPRLRERLQAIERPTVVRLTLDDIIRRTLQNSYLIQVQAYNPAIESARVVEAEANFDAVFFASFQNQKQDVPTASQLSSSASQSRVFQSGIRKLLSSGMQVQTGYSATRNETNLVFQTLNPSYFNQFFVEFSQPLLRGFGLDYNRSQIQVRKLDRQISVEQFRREVRETLFNVEQAYWRLFQARRNITASARLLTSLQTILESLQQRLLLGYDVYPVQVKLTESRYEQRQAEFVRLKNEVRNAEDALKALMNDPDINFAREIEIIPVDSPSFEPITIDALGELSAALAYRSELHEARLQIEQAALTIGIAKNQALPKLDLMFRYVVDGLGANWDRAFSQLSQNNFHEYVIQLQFEWPIGNRGPEAVLRQARLRQAQAIAAHRGQIENVLAETQTAIRDLYTAYDQIGPSLRSAQASADQLYATQVRQERRDLPSLQVELDAHELLATSRQTLLKALADYNIAMTNLERRKGTLLRYNNIALKDADQNSPYEVYRPEEKK